MDNIFEKIDKTGVGCKGDEAAIVLDKEIKRSHRLSLKLSNMSVEDKDYKNTIEELLNAKIDDSVIIFSPFYCDCGPRLKLGKNIIINKGATILPVGIVEIEDNVLIAPDVKITTINHDLYDRHGKCYMKKITIKNNAWICMGAIICPGVTIGENSVVAAGAVVTKDVPANTVVAGNPAKIIKKLDEKEMVVSNKL